MGFGPAPSGARRAHVRKWLAVLPRRILGQGIVVSLAAPFLLFPSVLPVATAVASVCVAAIWLAGSRRRAPQAVTPLDGALLVWAVMVSVGAAVTAFPERMLPKLTGLLLGMTVWRVASRLGRTDGELAWLTWAFTGLGLGFGILGGLTTDWQSKIPALDGIVSRLPTFSLALPGAPEVGVHANELGGALVPYLAYGLSMGIGMLASNGEEPDPSTGESGSRQHARYAQPRSAPRRLALAVVGVALLAVTAVLTLSQSRSAWLGALISCAVVIALWGRLLPKGPLRSILRVGLALAFIGGIVILAAVGQEGLQRLWEVQAQLYAMGGLDTLSFRFEIWRWATLVVQDFAYTGCGLGAFREVGRLLYPMNVPVNYDFAHAHNIFLQVALDTGIPGLVAYLAILAIAVRITWQTARRRPARRPLAIGLLSGLLALHIYGLLDAIAPGAKPGVIFWMMLGMVAAVGRRQSAQAGNRSERVGQSANGEAATSPQTVATGGRESTDNALRASTRHLDSSV